MKFFRIISLLIVSTGIGIFGFIIYSGYEGFINVLSELSGFTDKTNLKAFFRESQFTFFRVIAVLLIVGGLLSFIFSRAIAHFFIGLWQQLERLRRSTFLDIQMLPTFQKSFFYSFLSLIFLTKLYYIVSLPVHYDEAMNYLLYMSRGVLVSATYYSEPNNHILNTVFSSLALNLPIAETVAIRLPSLVFSTITVGLLFLALKKRMSFGVATLITVLFSFLTPIFYYGFLSRGYTLVVLGFVLIFHAGLQILQQPAPRFFLLLSIGSIIGLYANPPFLYPFLAIHGFLFFYFIKEKYWTNLKSLIFSGIATIIIAVLLYAPIILFNGIESLIGNVWVIPRTQLEVLQMIPKHLVGAYEYIFSFDYAVYLIIPLIILSLVATNYSKYALLSIWVLLFIPIALVLHATMPPNRVIIYLGLPVLFLIGLLMDKLPILFSLLKGNFLVGLVAILSFVFLIRNDENINHAERFSKYNTIITDYLKTEKAQNIYNIHLFGKHVTLYNLITSNHTINFKHVPILAYIYKIERNNVSYNTFNLDYEEMKNYEYVISDRELDKLKDSFVKKFHFKTYTNQFSDLILYENQQR